MIRIILENFRECFKGDKCEVFERLIAQYSDKIDCSKLLKLISESK